MNQLQGLRITERGENALILGSAALALAGIYGAAILAAALADLIGA